MEEKKSKKVKKRRGRKRLPLEPMRGNNRTKRLKPSKFIVI